MDLRLFFHDNYSHTKFLFASDGPLGSLPVFLHVLSLVLTFVDPAYRDSHLSLENRSIDG